MPTNTTQITSTSALLDDDMLAGFDERAPVYDRENRFFTEDWDELGRAGYLSCAVPTELGGGASRSTSPGVLRRLAYYAPATAIAVNMHSTGRASPRISTGPATSPAGGSSRGGSTVRCSAPCTARPATTCPCSSPPLVPPGSTADGRSPGTRSSAA
jgi:hypothetical protein